MDGAIDILVPQNLNGVEAGVYRVWTTSGNGAWHFLKKNIHFDNYET